MTTQFSYAFRESVKSLNASSILDSLLNIFNSSLIDISENENRLMVSFREWPESLLSHIFTINVDYHELSKKSLKINNLDSLVTDIIRTCDKEASKYFKSDSNLDLDFKLVIEKYALKDFITELTKNYFKEIVFKNLDGSLKKVNIVTSINGIDIPDSGAVVLDTIKDISADGSQVISVNTKTKYHSITLNTSNSSITFANPTQDEGTSKSPDSEASSTVIKLELFIKQGTGTNTVTWPTNVKWENGIEPVLSLEKDNVDLISLVSLDNGQNYYGFAKAVWMN